MTDQRMSEDGTDDLDGTGNQGDLGDLEELDDLDVTGIDVAGNTFERWLREHGLRYARHRRSSMDRVGTQHGHSMIDFLVLAPWPRSLAVLFKHERKAITLRQEEMLEYLAASGWRTTSAPTARDAITTTIEVVCGGSYPDPVARISGDRAHN